MKNGFLIAASFLAFAMPAFAQQPPTADQVQDLSIQLELTRQQLTEANKNFVNERSATIRLGRQLNETVADASRKDAQIKDLTAQLAAAKKPEKAPETEQKGEAEHMPPVLPAPPHVDTNVDAPK